MVRNRHEWQDAPRWHSKCLKCGIQISKSTHGKVRPCLPLEEKVTWEDFNNLYKGETEAINELIEVLKRMKDSFDSLAQTYDDYIKFCEEFTGASSNG